MPKRRGIFSKIPQERIVWHVMPFGHFYAVWACYAVLPSRIKRFAAFAAEAASRV